MPDWDIFISHASEDKEEVVIPLAAALERAGLLVWFDRQEVHLGDSLADKIDRGLSNSAIGVVILSPSFVASSWAQSELKALSAMEEAFGRTIVYPVWHRLDKAAVTRAFPRLADRIAATTADGMASVTEKIVDVVVRPDSEAPSVTRPTRLRLLNRLLDDTPDRQTMRDFFAAHAMLIHAGIGSTEFQSAVQLGPTTIDVCVARHMYTQGETHWQLIQLQPPSDPLFDGASPTPALATRVAEIKAARRWIGANLTQAGQVLPGIQVGIQGIVVAGRRNALSTADTERLRAYNEELTGLIVRTYDWIVDAAARRE
jgi:TIR domain